MALRHFKSVYIKMSRCEGCLYHYFKGFASFHENSARAVEFFLWSRRFTYCGQVPDVPKRLHLQRKSENLEVYKVYSPSLSRKAPMTNKLTEYFIKDRYG